MKLKRFRHKIQNTHRTTMDLGILYPMSFLDVPMGQTTLLKSSAMLRFQPLLAPVQMDLRCNIVHFYVPYRLLWSEWDDFISMRKEIELPLFKIHYVRESYANVGTSGTLLNYVGFPSHFNLNKQINIPFLWFLAYYKVWNEHFLDDEAQADKKVDLDKQFELYKNGLSSTSDNYITIQLRDTYCPLKRVNWRRDRFVKALLETETDPSITLPVGSNGAFMFQNYADPSLPQRPPAGISVAKDVEIAHPGGSEQYINPLVLNSSDYQPLDGLKYASGLTGVSLTDFILATNLWNFKQNQNLYGTEYEDYLRKYGIRNLDGRLQKSEFIGGFSDRVQISDVIATSAEDLGKQAGHAIGHMRRRVFKHYAPESGVIISFMYLRPRATYEGGIPRFFFKRDALDFPQLEFMNGYQPIFKHEISVPPNSSMNLPEDEKEFEIFGYEDRLEEYRIGREFISGALATGKNLSHWANPRTFTASPNFNNAFLECKPSTNVWATPNEDKAIVTYYGDFVCKNWILPSSPKKFKIL